MSYEPYAVVNTGGKFLLVVCDHDQRLVGAFAESLDDILHQPSVGIIKSMEWFVDDQQLRIFDEGSCEEYESLLSAGEL